MAVNLAPNQLQDPELARTVAEVLDEFALRPAQLVLEITEGALLSNDPQALATAAALRRLGVGLALDDFGTGFSSLAHLRRFPLTVLKIDRSFIADVDLDAEARHFLKAIARLGQDLQLDLVAEGIERSSQLDAVREVGAVLGQGYLFAAPARAEDFRVLVSNGGVGLRPRPAPHLLSAPRGRVVREFVRRRGA
jgi:EAL domain-containing protein (putative c-di-GMP-specific phosphodiesterase class I)